MTVSSSTLPASVSLCSNGLFPTRSLPSYFAAASRPPAPFLSLSQCLGRSSLIPLEGKAAVDI